MQNGYFSSLLHVPHGSSVVPQRDGASAFRQDGDVGGNFRKSVEIMSYKEIMHGF